MTPYDAWMKEKPKIKHLRVFGRDAYTKDEKAGIKVKKIHFFWTMGSWLKGTDFMTPIEDK